MRRFLVYWLPALVWTASVLTASSDQFSDAHSGHWLQRIAAWIFGHPLLPALLHRVNVIVRKSAHPTEYGILAALWFRALRGDRSGWHPKLAAAAVGVVVCVATIDEVHQSFIPSRNGTWHDVVLDTAGALVAMTLVRTALVLRSRRS
jgi:VanZ family protein